MRILIITLLVLNFGFLFAQKGKKNRDFKPLDVTELSEGEALKAETMLIEAERQLILENYFKAYELFKSALEIVPEDPAMNFKIAEVLTKNGDSQAALPYAEKAVKLDPENKYYLLLAAEIHKSLSNYKQAGELYEQMISTIPGTETYLYDLAIIYQYQGEEEKAIETYERAEDIFGMNEIVLREKQKIYLKNRDYESLITDWDKLISENPDDDQYVIELSEFLISKERFEEAKVRLETIGDSKEADLLLSRIALVEGDTPLAMELAQATFDSPEVDHHSKILMLNTFLEYAKTEEEQLVIIDLTQNLSDQYTETYEVQGFAGDVLYQLDKKQMALDHYLKAVEIDPGKFDVWQNVLNIEAELNNYDAVVKHAEEALEYFPNQAMFYYFLGTGHLINKDFKKCIHALNDGKKYVSNPELLTVFYGQIGDAHQGLKQSEKSYVAYEKALENDPDNDHVLNNYSYYLSIANEDLEKALKMSTKLVTLHPESATYLDTHGWVLYVLGRYDESLIYLRKAANMEEDGTIIEHYGDVLFKLGRTDEAVEQWKRAQMLNEPSENLEKKIAERRLYE